MEQICSLLNQKKKTPVPLLGKQLHLLTDSCFVLKVLGFLQTLHITLIVYSG